MNRHKIYLAGAWVEGETELTVENPYDASVAGITYIASSAQLQQALEKAKTVRKELQNFPTYQRYEALMFISSEILKNKDHLAKVLTQESGKPWRYSLGEVERCAQTFLVAAEESKRLPQEYIRLDWTKPGVNKEGIIKYFPVGVVAGISPFNFPLNLVAHKLAPAIAAGCPIILKPASATPLSALELAKIIDQTALPKGAISILPMTRETGETLVTSPLIDMLSFTGSDLVGWKMKERAGRKKVLLELGGNAGVLISPSSDIDLAVSKSLVSAFAFSGQICIHAQRFFVHESLFDEFVAKLKSAAAKIKVGSPLDPETEFSVMIDEANAKRVEGWVNEAVAEGATLIHGGKRKNSLYEPTILSNTNSNMKVNSLEVFGPVITIEKFSNFETAVEMLNDSAFGLQAGVFTTLQKEVDYAFNYIEAGGITINEVPSFRADHMPYGGIKNSGLGREGVKYAIFEMMEPRILVKDII